MPIILKIKACISKNCTTISLSETTGIYDGILNITGYGYPNIEKTDIISSSIIITLPDGNLVPIINPIGLPSSDPNLSYEIPFSILNASYSKIPDGLYKITYNLVSNETPEVTYTTSEYFLFTCNIECCIAKLYSQITTSTDCSCDSHIIKNALYASTLMKGLKANKGNCGNITAINNLLKELNNICGSLSEDCDCN